MEFLDKHCFTAKEGNIALSDKFVTNSKNQGKSVRVTCDAYPGQSSTYTPEELAKPVCTFGPYNDKYSKDEDATYYLYIYAWKGNAPLPEAADSALVTVETFKEGKKTIGKSFVEKKGTGYVIKTPVMITTYEEREISLVEFIAERVKELREGRGITMTELARKANISQTTVSELEAGNLNNPTFQTLEGIATGLGVHLTDLMPSIN